MPKRLRKESAVARAAQKPKRRVDLTQIALVTAAVAAAFVPIPPVAIEVVYSRGTYALWQPAATFVSNLAPFAWLDGLALAVFALFTIAMVKDVRTRGWQRAAGAVALRAAVWSAALYLVFLASWGFNYRRQALSERLPFNEARITPAAAARLATVSVDRINSLHAGAHAEGWVSGSAIDPALAGALDGVVRDLRASPRGIVVGRPKRSLIDWYFQRAGVSGMTDPFFLETLIAGDLLPFERPHVIAHEWAHLAGLANEGEANLAGWLACVRASMADQYSGWLFMYTEAIGAVPVRERGAIMARVNEGPRADLRAMRERTLRHVNPRLSSAGWRMYDSYLKANRVEAGTASYAEVVRLVLGLDITRNLR